MLYDETKGRDAKMNPSEIGKFIADCRKEKQLTQVQLAEKLNITNRAVSKWETGKSVPDASIMLELCNILEITVNELLSSERIISLEDYRNRAEENLVELQEKKTKAHIDLLKMELLWFGLVVLLVPVHFAINYYYPNNKGTGIGLLMIFLGIILFLIYFKNHLKIVLK